MKKIGIAGVGGIGSNVAVQLVRSGVNKLLFGDFDIIDKSNLNRQFYFYDQIGKYKVNALENNLKKICPTGIFKSEIIRFDRNNIVNFFKDCEIIVEGFDNKINKKILVEELLPLKKMVVITSGIGGTHYDEIKIKKVSDKFYVVGDFVSDISIEETFSHKIMIISSLITEIVLEKGGYIAK